MVNELTARILVVDDNENNREVLRRRLEKQGHTVTTAENGEQTMDLIAKQTFDLLLLDIMMPVMDGFEVLTRMNQNGTLRDLPVIVISAGTDVEHVIRCIGLGADDYLSKPFNSSLLKARIQSSLEKKFLRDSEQRTQKALEAVNRKLESELVEAAEYVRSLLPLPIEGELNTDWQFLPSAYLGGDSFGYNWLDPDRFAIYLLDVCGHGVGAALLSVMVMDVLNSRSLSEVDFLDPSSVLSALNRLYPMERHSDKFFTAWYGIYDKRDFTLTYASAGHPPAVLIDPQGSQLLLTTSGPAIGLLPNAFFTSAKITVDRPSKLIVFSDGVYENKKSDGSILRLEEFLKHIQNIPWDASSVSLLNMIRVLCPFPFDDDFSIVQVRFQT